MPNRAAASPPPLLVLAVLPPAAVSLPETNLAVSGVESLGEVLSVR